MCCFDLFEDVTISFAHLSLQCGTRCREPDDLAKSSRSHVFAP